MGLVVNKPTDMSLASLFERVELAHPDAELAGQPVMFGGPVQLDRAFVLHKPAKPWQSTMRITDEIALTSSKDILEAAAVGNGPDKMLITLGYAGWSAGQLEDELSKNAWLTVKASDNVIFDIPNEQKFNAAMQLLGLDFANLSEVAGHA